MKYKFLQTVNAKLKYSCPMSHLQHCDATEFIFSGIGTKYLVIQISS